MHPGPTVMAALFVAAMLAGCAGGDGGPSSGETPPPARDPALEGPAAAATMGRWGASFDGEVPAVTINLLPDGRLLYWGGLHTEAAVGALFLSKADNAETRLLDLSGPTPTVTTPDPSDGGRDDLFCADQVHLPGGRILAVGGSYWNAIGPGYQVGEGAVLDGSDQTLVFDPATDTWTPGPTMAAPRWYPTVATLPDGDAIIVSGMSDLAMPQTFVRFVERYDADDGTLSILPGPERELPMYPRLWVVPSGPMKGQLFYQPSGCLWCPSGSAAASQYPAALLDPDTGAWTEFGLSMYGLRQYPASILLPLRAPDYAATIFTSSGTVERTGSPIAFSEYTDLGGAVPVFRAGPPMPTPRWFSSPVGLPDGTFLVLGGAQIDGVVTHGNDKHAPVLAMHLFDPEAPGADGAGGAWSAVPDLPRPRLYHHTAMLLPDGRVLVGGSVPIPQPHESEHIHETTFDVYEPPYLFRGDRPRIAAAPGEVAHGQPFTVASPDAGDITGVVLIRAPSLTHTFDPDQRTIGLTFEARGATLVVDAPPDGAVAPPGLYMLFVLRDTADGPVPSRAALVTVGT